MDEKQNYKREEESLFGFRLIEFSSYNRNYIWSIIYYMPLQIRKKKENTIFCDCKVIHKYTNNWGLDYVCVDIRIKNMNNKITADKRE